jgi:hypothetical protein
MSTPISRCLPCAQSSFWLLEPCVGEEDGKGDTNAIIMGDWNSVVGDETYQNIVGSHGLGRQNHRGQMLIDFCERRILLYYTNITPNTTNTKAHLSKRC